MIQGAQSKKQKIIEKSKELALSSTFIGLPNIFRTDKACLKLMWLVLLITGISIGIYITIKTILDYLDYEVVTSIKVINEIPTEFPAVTFFILRNKTANIPLDNLILTCQYNKFDCKELDINISINKDEFGFISYTFKSQKAYQSSTKFGLTIGLNLTNIPIDFNHLSNIQDGVRVIIHNQTSDPEYYLGDSNNGFNLAPGLIYEISVKRIFTYKLGQPYNNCLKDVIYFTEYYENLDYPVIDQVAKMTELDLISNIGGNLGLFIGISFLSFAELI